MICVNLLVEDGWVQQRQGASALFGGGLCYVDCYDDDDLMGHFL